MFSMPFLTDKTVEFLTESTYGDTWREVIQIPNKYRWLKSLMEVDGRQVANELECHGLAVATNDGRVFVNMTKLPELEELLERLERN